MYLETLGSVNEVGDESDLDEETQDRIKKEMERFTKELDANKDGHLDKVRLSLAMHPLSIRHCNKHKFESTALTYCCVL